MFHPDMFQICINIHVIIVKCYPEIGKYFTIKDIVDINIYPTT